MGIGTRDALARDEAVPEGQVDAPTRTSLAVVKSAYRTALDGFALPYGDVAVGGWRNTPYVVIQNVGAYLDTPRFLDSDHPVHDAADAEAYLARREALLAEIAERRRRSDALKDPGVVRETDFQDDRLLDAVFHRHAGEGATSMTLAGILVTKTLSRHPSNSGKSQGWSVAFSWTGSDGRRRSSGREAPEASNRRNDPERNWGLHE